jgi:hypothetical protein
MSDDEMSFKYRPGFFVRKRDGRRVRAADWEDGEVSWILDPIPIIAPNMVGTMSAESFEKSFLPLPESPGTAG